MTINDEKKRSSVCTDDSISKNHSLSTYPLLLAISLRSWLFMFWITVAANSSFRSLSLLFVHSPFRSTALPNTTLSALIDIVCSHLEQVKMENGGIPVKLISIMRFCRLMSHLNLTSTYFNGSCISLNVSRTHIIEQSASHEKILVHCTQVKEVFVKWVRKLFTLNSHSWNLKDENWWKFPKGSVTAQILAYLPSANFQPRKEPETGAGS